MKYDPRYDDCLRCLCGDSTEYDENWARQFEKLIDEQLDILRVERKRLAPSVCIERAIGRLAVSIAHLASSRNDSKSYQPRDQMCAQVPAMLASMVEDARRVMGIDVVDTGKGDEVPEIEMRDLLDEQMDIAMAEYDDLDCPRSLVRHAIARLATTVAFCNPVEQDAELQREISIRLYEAVDLAAFDVRELVEKPTRGEAAGWRRVN